MTLAPLLSCASVINFCASVAGTTRIARAQNQMPTSCAIEHSKFSRRLIMAQRKSSGSRKYGKAAGKSVKSAMHREKRGTLKSGRGGKGGTVKRRKQAIAIGLSV